MFHLLIILLITDVYSLTCKDILKLPDVYKLQTHELQTLPPQEVVECLSHLGEKRLTLAQDEFIWYSIIEFYQGISNIPDEILENLHYVTTAIRPKEYENITISTLDVITNFGFNYGLTDDQLSAIAERIHWDFGFKQPEDYSAYDLRALNQILCVFNKSEIERIQPKAYKEVSLVIGKLKNCHFEVLQGFATVAVADKAFGSPHKWTNSSIYSLGVVAAHLPEDIALLMKKKFGSDILKRVSKPD